MIGPGTDVALFRSYMQEREELGFEGNTWLFLEITSLHYRFSASKRNGKNGLKMELLSKLDACFSRDTDKKCMCAT